MKTSEPSLSRAAARPSLAMIACTGPVEPVTPQVREQYSCHGRTLGESTGCNFCWYPKCPPADTADTCFARPAAIVPALARGARDAVQSRLPLATAASTCPMDPRDLLSRLSADAPLSGSALAGAL